MAIKNTPTKYNIQHDPLSKPAKYLNFRMQDISKEESKVLAGYSPKTHATLIENTKLFQSAREEAKAGLIALPEILKEHNKNIKQDADKGAKNKAIQMAYDIHGVVKEDFEDIGDVNITIKRTDGKEEKVVFKNE